MSAKKIVGFDILAIAFILALCVSYNSGEELEKNSKLAELVTGNLKHDEIVKDFNDEEATREKRGIKLRPPKPIVPKPKPKTSLPEGHTRHTAPKTKDIGIPGLVEQKPKSSVQGGGGKRERWTDEKNRKTYEWDSRHGELEVYRNSDKKHLGSVDPNTGEKVKDAVPDRKLKE